MPTQTAPEWTISDLADVLGGAADPLGPADLTDLVHTNLQPILSIGDACSLSCSWCCWLSVTCD